MAATISQLREAIVGSIVAAFPSQFTVSGTYLGNRELGALDGIVVDVVIGPGEPDLEAVATTEIRRTVSVVVRRHVDPSDVSQIDSVVEAAEAIGVHLMNGELAIEPRAVGLELEAVDPDSLIHSIAETAANVVYLVQGVA